MMGDQRPTILVIGGTGQVGSAVVRHLCAAGHQALAGSRHGSVLVDHDKPETYAAAFEGIAALFVAVPDRPDSIDIERRIYAAAADADIRKIVKLSAASAGWNPPASFGVAHRASEEALSAIGIAWTVLRPTVFQETIGMFCDDALKGRMIVPRCKGAITFVSIDDVAAVAAQVLVTDTEEGAILDLTGPQGLTFDEVAAELSTNIGRSVRHISIPRFAARRVLPRAAGMSPWMAGQVVDLFAGLHSGEQSTVGDEVERILGRAATRLEECIDDLVS